MKSTKSLSRITQKGRLLTAAKFQRLADVPAEVELFRNIDNPHTERAYRHAIADFMRFTGIRQPDEFRVVTRAHVIAWRDELVGSHLDRASVETERDITEGYARPGEALAIYKQSLSLMEQDDDLVNAGAVLHQIGNCQFDLKQFDSALEAYLKAAVIFADVGIRRHLSNSVSQTG